LKRSTYAIDSKKKRRKGKPSREEGGLLKVAIVRAVSEGPVTVGMFSRKGEGR